MFRRLILSLFLLATPLLAGGADAELPKDKATFKVVNYAGLADVIRQQRGKVVVVDFWADY
jgi:hypothetical protein